MADATSTRDNEERLDSLYNRYCERIYTLCLRLCGDASDAETATADAFVRFFQGISPRSKEPRTFFCLRDLAIEVALERPSGSLLEPSTTNITPPSPAASVIDSLIVQLRLIERAVYVLHDLEHLSDRAIARHLGVSEKAVQASLKKARLELLRLWRWHTRSVQSVENF